MVEHLWHKTINVSKHKLENIISAMVMEESLGRFKTSCLKMWAPDLEHQNSDPGSIT